MDSWLSKNTSTFRPLREKKSLQKNYNERKKAAAHIDNFHVIEQ